LAQQPIARSEESLRLQLYPHRESCHFSASEREARCEERGEKFAPHNVAVYRTVYLRGTLKMTA
jgi:hypothetical protein